MFIGQIRSRVVKYRTVENAWDILRKVSVFLGNYQFYKVFQRKQSKVVRTFLVFWGIYQFLNMWGDHKKICWKFPEEVVNQVLRRLVILEKYQSRKVE